MKCKSLFFLMIFIFTGLQSFSQIEKPKKKPFNIGISTALGGVNFLFPSIDLNYKSAMIRVSPHFLNFGLGYTQEITRISPTFFNCYWIASLYFGISSYNGIYAHKYVEKMEERPEYSQKAALLTGVKVYYGKRWYSIVQLGVQYINHNAYTSISPQYVSSPIVYQNPLKKEWLPYFEFGIGLNLFKTYPTVDDISN